MSKFNLRQKPRISYCEYEEPNLDEYVFCEQCGDFVYEYCSIHGPLLVVPDDKVPAKTNYPSFVPRAALTIPKVFLHIAPSIIPGAGLGVFTTLTLPRGVRFGPYRGERTTKIESMYCWQLHDGNNKWSHVVDASDANASNWMRYVNCARHWCEQNLVAYQYQGQIYYRTIKIIPRFTELLVFYGGEYARLLDVNLKHYNSPSGYAQKFGAKVQKKLKLSTDIGNRVNQKTQTNPTEEAVEGKTNSEDIQKTLQNTNQKTVFTKTDCSNEDNSTISNTNIGYDEKKQEKCSTLKNNYTCDVCKKKFYSKFFLKSHVNLHFKVIRQKRNTLSSNDVIKHTRIEVNIVNNNERILKGEKCHFCNKCFKRKVHLTVHIRTHTGEKPYQCNVCSKCFSHKRCLTSHIRTHTGEKPYQCNVCNKSFSDKRVLTVHIRTHTGEKPYQCNVCNKSFSHKSYLTSHIRTHTGEKPYQCNVCSKCFSHKSCLTSHIRTHTGEKPYQCNVCNKSFSDKRVLTVHIRTHTGEKPYQCNVCNKFFSHKNHLTSHIRTHTGEKPYLCNFCSKCFTLKHNLTRHIRTHTGEKPYQCNFCKESFSQKKYLTLHIRTHTGEKPYQCNFCNKYFSQKNCLTSHIRTHTGEKPSV